MVESKENYKVMVMALFLAGLLILSHNFVRPEVVTANDYLRVLIFIVIAFVVAALSERIVKLHENGPMNEITFEVNQRLAPAIARDITERKWAEAGGKNHEA